MFLIDGDIVEIFLGSTCAYIQVEAEDFAQFYDSSDDPFYEQFTDYSKVDDLEYALECDIEQLLDATKIKVRLFNKIKYHLDEIERLCYESELSIDYEDLLELNYNL